MRAAEPRWLPLNSHKLVYNIIVVAFIVMLYLSVIVSTWEILSAIRDAWPMVLNVSHNSDVDCCVLLFVNTSRMAWIRLDVNGNSVYILDNDFETMPARSSFKIYTQIFVVQKLAAEKYRKIALLLKKIRQNYWKNSCIENMYIYWNRTKCLSQTESTGHSRLTFSTLDYIRYDKQSSIFLYNLR